MWLPSTMAWVWAVGSLTGIMGWVLNGYRLHPQNPLHYHPGFWAWPAVFGCATLALSRWPDVALWASGGVLYGLAWVLTLEHVK